uniref:BAG domain-containing protein n=1 Tax=Pectinophora gossypiella TaxID=13191 RepID=A0A1E1WPT7_PECGO
MESPVVVDKPPEYHGNDNDRGFPFDEEEGSGAWSELAARHPDIAARLRHHPAGWASKRRPNSQHDDDFGDRFSGFDRFPFDEIPPEFRGHFPSHWNRRFGPREEVPQPQPQTSNQPQPQSPQQQTTATQTEPNQPPEPQTSLPQYGLRNTVDLGQKSAVDPSLVNADDRNQRSMSAPPESANHTKMSGQNHQEAPHSEPQPQAHSKVRNIPIIVEGRDQPVINENFDHAGHFGESKPAYVPHQHPHPHQHQHQQPPLDSTYFTEEGPINFNHPPNFTRAFGTPFGKPYRQGQPFAQQKVYPQSATNFARGASPQRSQSPKPQHEEFIKVPVQHEAPKQQPRPQPKPQPPQQPQQPPQQQQPPPPPQQQKEATPPPQPKPASPADPITQILAIQTDVLNLMTEVENFTGTKKDKRYLFLDEMLTRNLIKLDNIETEGKENIRNARKEAIRCIQKCIAVLEAKADKGGSTPQPQENQEAPADVDMNSQPSEPEQAANGEVDMKEPSKDEAAPEQQPAAAAAAPEPAEAPQAADTRPDEKPAEPEATETKEDNVDKKTKKVVKNVKKRDKSKDKAAKGEADSKEVMQVDDKGDKPAGMEVDGAASQ